jgi:hypothetical protein
MEQGTLLRAPSVIRGSLLLPHPLADAVTPGGKLAKASLPGEGQGEGRFLQFDMPSSLQLAPMHPRGNGNRAKAALAIRRQALALTFVPITGRLVQKLRGSDRHRRRHTHKRCPGAGY